jgi:hypothetical protein
VKLIALEYTTRLPGTPYAGACRSWHTSKDAAERQARILRKRHPGLYIALKVYTVHFDTTRPALAEFLNKCESGDALETLSLPQVLQNRIVVESVANLPAPSPLSEG